MSLRNRFLLALASALMFTGLFWWLHLQGNGPQDGQSGHAASGGQGTPTSEGGPPASAALEKRRWSRSGRPPAFTPPPSLTRRPGDARAIGEGEAITRQNLLETGPADPELQRRSADFVKLWRAQHPEMMVVETSCYGEGCVSELEFDSPVAYEDFVEQFGRSNAARSWEGQFSIVAPVLAATGKIRSAWYLFKSGDFIERARKKSQPL
jgi:hypothetical protein